MGHMLSKRGAENPEDVLGVFFGEAYLHRIGDEMQQWWGARA